MKPDPNFPNRPTHPDFDVLSAAVIENDSRADDGGDIDPIIAQYVDPESLAYMAIQRAMKMTGSTDKQTVTRLAGGIIDGFVMGANYMVRRFGDDPGSVIDAAMRAIIDNAVIDSGYLCEFCGERIMPMATCAECGEQITESDNSEDGWTHIFGDADHGAAVTWIDESLGDWCPGNDEGENENEPHTPWSPIPDVARCNNCGEPTDDDGTCTNVGCALRGQIVHAPIDVAIATRRQPNVKDRTTDPNE